MEQIEEPKIQESSPEYKSPSKKNSKGTGALCRHYAKGFCYLGQKCKFRHTMFEGESTDVPVLCRNYREGYCKYGDFCHFVHSDYKSHSGENIKDYNYQEEYNTDGRKHRMSVDSISTAVSGYECSPQRPFPDHGSHPQMLTAMSPMEGKMIVPFQEETTKGRSMSDIYDGYQFDMYIYNQYNQMGTQGQNTHSHL